MGRRGELRVAARGGGRAVAHVVEVAAYRALVAGEAHGHALVGRPGLHHLALLAVLDLVAVLEGLTHPCEVDLLAHRVAARQRRWRLAAYLCVDTAHS